MTPRIKIGLEILLSLSSAVPSATVTELAHDFYPNEAITASRKKISQALYFLKKLGWQIIKISDGQLLLGGKHYQLLLDWSRRKNERQGCYGVRPFTPENLKRFCEMLL